MKPSSTSGVKYWFPLLGRLGSLIEAMNLTLVLGVDSYPDDMLVLPFGPRLVCRCCGIIDADARPNWKEQVERPSHAAIS
jgi:hypothetical protein